MGEMMYCPQCHENRMTTMDINWIICIILLLLGVVLGIVYLLYCYIEKRRCPVCGTSSKLMEPPRYQQPPTN